jgi:glycosyltransferase involved in cell wall biosynthesis
LPKAKGFIVGDFSDGDKAYIKEVRELITHYGLDNHIILTGYRKDVPAIMQLMDVIVHASIKPEPFGMVLIEGMAMGKPIVATKMAGPLDIVTDGQTGILVEPGDIKNMATAVLRILAEKPLAKTMGRDGRDRVTALFTKERYARQVEKVYMHELGIG